MDTSFFVSIGAVNPSLTAIANAIRVGDHLLQRLGVSGRPMPTASRTEIGVVYVAAVVQGLALVTFPAASSIFTSPDGFGFDSTRYGAMFVPQVVLAILASALAPKLARRWSLRRVLLAGFAGDIVAMALLALSRLLLGAPDVAFGVLLLATGALGLGFGATVMALNTYAEAFFPGRADRRGAGAQCAARPGHRAGAGAGGDRRRRGRLVAAAGRGGVRAGAAVRRRPDAAAGHPPGAGGAPDAGELGNLPHRFWLYAAAVFLYGIRRDAERQLGHALSQRRARRVGPGRLVRAHRLLGDGDCRGAS